MNHVIETPIGSEINNVATNAVKASAKLNQNIEFEFNGIVCVVNKDTNVEHLVRDYMNAHLMGWKTIGPVCQEAYSPEIQQEYESKWAARNEIQQKIQEAARLKDEEQARVFYVKTKGVELELIDKEGFDQWKANNVDPYSNTIFEYAEGWAKLMQVEMSQGKKLEEVAKETSFQLGFLGITGFMYSCAVTVLANHWKYGKQLKEWNKPTLTHN